MLQGWDNEIFKYLVSENSIELIVEDKYASEAGYQLEQQGILPLSREQGIGYVTLVGLGINLDPGFLARTLELCSGFQIRRVQHSEMTIELMLPSPQVRDCVAVLHSAFLEGER